MSAGRSDHHEHCGHAHAGAHHEHAGHTAENGTRDPVCHMTVDPHTAKHRHTHAGRPYYFCSAGCLAKFKADPAKYLAPAQGERAGAGRHDLHLPDASGGPPGRAGLVPDLRHGAGAAARERGRGTERRADRHEPPVLDRPRAQRSGLRARDGRTPHRAQPHDRPADLELAAARARHAGRAVGGLAVLRARLAVGRHAQSQHVHADRARHRRRLGLQRGGDARARNVSGGVARPRRGRGLFRGGRGHHGAGAARSGAGAARARGDRRRDPRAARPRAEDRAAHRAAVSRKRYRSIRCRSATGCACAPARRCRSTAQWSKGAARSTSRW